MNVRKKELVPADIPLPERVLLEDGVMFVSLPTLDELERFWNEHKDQFRYACEGKEDDLPATFLSRYQWVFGKTKSAVIRTVMRWGKSKIDCEFYDWARHEPAEHEFWFEDRDAYRAWLMQNHEWTEEQETQYLARTPTSYRGWWRLKNLPAQYSPEDWFSPASKHEELIDPSMSPADAAEKLHEQTFDEWMWTDPIIIECYDQVGIEEVISYWQSERAAGDGYYGEENEARNTLHLG